MHLFSMKTWVLSIVIVVFSISVISLIFPTGKLGKFIKAIFSFVLIFVVLKPVVGIKNFDYNIEDVFNKNEVVIQNLYLEYINDKKIEVYRNNCIKLMEKSGVYNANIDFEYEIAKYGKFLFKIVSLNLENAVINSDKEHIVIIETLKSEIKRYLNLNEDFLITVIEK